MVAWESNIDIHSIYCIDQIFYKSDGERVKRTSVTIKSLLLKKILLTFPTINGYCMKYEGAEQYEKFLELINASGDIVMTNK